MINYYGLNTPLRALLMSALFVVANLAFATIFRIIKRKRALHAKILLPSVSAINAFFCICLPPKQERSNSHVNYQK